MNPRHKHDYAHSWRSKAPVIYRNTPQWFIAMDKPAAVKGSKQKASLRELAVKIDRRDALRAAAGQQPHRRHGRAAPGLGHLAPAGLGVPITVFVHKETGEAIPGAKFKGSKVLQKRIADAFKAEGADAWFADGAATAFSRGLSITPPIGSRCATFSTCGSIRARRMPSASKSAKT